jgi:hypothetical protein
MRLDEWGNRHNLPGGSIYVLHAVKQVSALHRPRRQWQLRRERLISLVPKPAPAPTPTPYRPTQTGIAHRQPGAKGAV